MHGLLPFGTILASTVLGLSGMPPWTAVACGVLLAAFAVAERRSLTERAIKIERVDVLSLASGASLLNALAASIGTFAVGRLIGRLFI